MFKVMISLAFAFKVKIFVIFGHKLHLKSRFLEERGREEEGKESRKERKKGGKNRM